MTASKFKAAAPTDLSQPSQSLLKAICYPDSYRFSTVATRWGCVHESAARDTYLARMVKNHLNFTIHDCGLVIHPQYPHLGASPDGFVKCYCCTCGVLEIKCPFSCKDRSFLQSTGDHTFCLETTDGNFVLKREHAYFYQVQLQMELCGVNYCDFVIWRASELVINKDEAFLIKVIDKATTFFKYGVLPELIAKWYTQKSSFSIDTETSSQALIDIIRNTRVNRC